MKDFNSIVAQIVAVLWQIISVAVVLLIFGAVVQLFGIRIPQLPAIDPTKLVYLCGCVWLARK